MKNEETEKGFQEQNILEQPLRKEWQKPELFEIAAEETETFIGGHSDGGNFS